MPNQKKLPINDNQESHCWPTRPAHPARVSAIKRWHVDQAIGESRPVALLSITLTDACMIDTEGVGIEPEHVPIFLVELERIRQQLIKASTPSANTQGATVTQLWPDQTHTKTAP